MNREHIGKYLGMIHRLHITLIDKRLEPYDISHGQLFLLLAIYNKEGITQNDLCEMYKIDKAAVSKSIKKLIDEDFLIRERDNKDKRKQLLYLTNKAKNFEGEFRSVLQAIEEDSTKGLSMDELNSFFNVSNKIIDNLSNKLSI
ncbi:winged helix-turn-helix transcriptional regulator [Clostridium sp. D2Q-11]|uniref:Winged helix-turn-helix transcriptional regulator n=1 Tax=Anaeromonas frigoriresistens TaxID=2683708 RepID=A0A942Z7S7_9FIRM|nr:MarR family winged helix-turn-helix transcriptional regulator [Anaeromonas frigoriresistens]MBS4539032.1 winged helix-turn-helix transcriptional regulator [Anaeromonas frigoriresistens]